MAEIIFLPAAGLALPSVGAAEILDEFRSVGNIVEIKVFRQRRKLPFQREIAVSFAVFADVGADVVWILQVRDHEKRPFRPGRQVLNGLFRCVDVQIRLIIEFDGRIRPRDMDFLGFDDLKASQCPIIMSLAKMHTIITGMGKQFSQRRNIVGDRWKALIGQVGEHAGLVRIARGPERGPGRLTERTGSIGILHDGAPGRQTVEIRRGRICIAVGT